MGAVTRSVARLVSNIGPRVTDNLLSRVGSSSVDRAIGATPTPPPAPAPSAPVTAAQNSLSIAAAEAPLTKARRDPIRAAGGQGDAARLASGGGGGDTGLALDPLGRRGRGYIGHATLLGR